MIVFSKWLEEYVQIPVDADELAHRLTMAGLNLEGMETLEDGFALDLEVTSNRPDCLGHIGVAREIATLLNQQLKVADPAPKTGSTRVGDLTKVRIECPELCFRYTARVIRGVKVGPSPDWLAQRLAGIGQPVINNIVDVTNYVMMESGQPLHAFDLAKLAGPEIIVRESKAGEPFKAIDHRTYELTPGMCVIADADRAVALGGVMGGADTEVSATTVDLLIEAADFQPLAIRGAARRLKLHSPSSYRFERTVDPVGVDWASRRCCELILDVAGGELAEGVLDVGKPIAVREPVTLRQEQTARVLGIEIETSEVERILCKLGCDKIEGGESFQVRPPTWRRDLTREIDLIEEIARIHGYDKIPEDANVPMAPSHRSHHDRVLASVRRTLTSAGYDEAITRSVVGREWSEAFSPWTDQPGLVSLTPMVKGESHVRRTLTPSLLGARRTNESLGNPVIELFETASLYLPRTDDFPLEQWTLALVSGRGFFHVKGLMEALVAALNPQAELSITATSVDLLDADQSGELHLSGARLGWIGEISKEGRKRFKLRGPAAIVEIDLGALSAAANFIPQYVKPPQYPAIDRDLNVIVDEALAWADLASTIRASGGPLLESLTYQETYRDPEADGAGKKRLLFTIAFRSHETTLTNEEADRYRDEIVKAISTDHDGRILG